LAAARERVGLVVGEGTDVVGSICRPYPSHRRSLFRLLIRTRTLLPAPMIRWVDSLTEGFLLWIAPAPEVPMELAVEVREAAFVSARHRPDARH